MSERGSPRALVIGAGLTGSLMACFLARDGWSVEVRERRADPRAKGYSGGRSINLALSARGLHALAEVGLAERVLRDDAVRMPGRMIHPATSQNPAALPFFQPYSANPADAINSVSRGGLNLTLLKAAAEHTSVSFAFDSACVDVDLGGPEALFARTTNGAWPPSGAPVERVSADLIVCTDGAFSVARLAMMKTDRYEYAQTFLHHGYKELVIPEAKDGGFALERDALHIWPRGGSMMIALPNLDGSFTCTLFWPFEGDHSFAGLLGADEILAHFARHYPDAVPHMPTLVEDFQRNPVGSLVTVRCFPWQHAGRVVLVGDSAHAIVPFYGQGMNCGFEDCAVLAASLRAHRGDRRAALDAYQQSRKPNADAIAEMALANFVEMRDTSALPEFHYRKKLERAIHRIAGDRFIPQYDLVSFSTVPYTEALSRGRAMAAAVARVEAILPMAQGRTLTDDAVDAFVRARRSDAAL
ncbi:MAG: FAD-dependent oxidoreductase [Phycisphaerales bacterium]